MTPSITILVPTIGRMEFLPDTRRAIDAQTRTDFCVIVLDNASPPAARAYLDEWSKADTRVEIARLEERIPMFSNFNRGMRAVRTPFVTFFHDDDVYRPRFLEVLVGALEQHPTAAFSGSNFDFVDENGALLEKRRWIARTAWWSGERYIHSLVSRGRNTVPMPGLVFRREAYPVDGFDESLPIHFGDFVLLMRSVEERGMVACAEPVVGIRKHSGQASQTTQSVTIPLRTRLMREYLDELVGRHPRTSPLAVSLRRRLEVNHRLGMLMGWISATDEVERDACLDGLGESSPDVALRVSLKWLDQHGLRAQAVSGRLATLARSAARIFRL